MKARIAYIDNLKGFAILLVVIGHIIQFLYCPDKFDSNIIFRFIYSFHMPLFVIVAGMFYKKKPIKDLVWGGIKTLIIPFYIVALLSFFLFQLLVIVLKK